MIGGYLGLQAENIDSFLVCSYQGVAMELDLTNFIDRGSSRMT